MLSDLIIPTPIWLAVATLGWYLASRAISGPPGQGRDGRTLLALMLPVATTCIAALWLRHPEVAIGVTLASSVAALTLVLGLVGLTHPIAPPIVSRMTWFFLLPTAAIALLIGFSGEIRPAHGLFLLLQGLAIWIGTSGGVAERSEATEREAGSRFVVIGFAFVAMLVASLLAVQAADSISRDLQQPGSGLVAAVMLTPALVLPMIGLTSRLAGDRQPTESVHLIVNVVLINLCLLLPLSAIAWQTLPTERPNLLRVATTAPATAPSTQPTTSPTDDSAQNVRFVYPISVWRIDTVLLVVMAIFLLLLALGRIQLGRPEATALVIVYVAYLMLTAVAAR